MKSLSKPILVVSALLCSVTGNAFAITPGGSGGSSPTAPPPAPVVRPPDSQPAPPPRGALPFPQTAEEMRQALGRGKERGFSRDMAGLNAAGFGSFIEFDSASAAVIPSPGLYEILKALTVPPLQANEHITITGHTDSDGGDAYNMDLSLRRANAVRVWLINSGVRPDALRADGCGERQPIATNATVAGKRQNRRVEFSAKSWGATAQQCQ